MYNNGKKSVAPSSENRDSRMIDFSAFSNPSAIADLERVAASEAPVKEPVSSQKDRARWVAIAAGFAEIFFNQGSLVQRVAPDERPLERHEFENPLAKQSAIWRNQF